ncbi:MAG: uroporphyrinogen-III C-methyltransferase [Sphingobacterium sp.]|jgi:uroporphyrin-III C-methyltransferase|uniref:uroporphyrinogen-III C-methyltransferase n=1 Tax=Sphingobacterium sp. TaxID=341027 RepID=UPI002841B4B6|nr:uroporphyrinogen-III C-methyltransferase [Sphingobacterium sp.]MDR3006427.1 uroporphyrinogen-III C-methyltransferase [Sphingobacterium sp.]
MSIKAKVTLVGAGPGDPELISLKGIKAIEKADVILYDALVNEELLDYAAPDCIKIYVGKRAEQLSTSQDEINRLLVDYALNYGHVVRLKGGDPFVFGRGGEEIDYVHQYGIETSVVPGISSAIGLTGLQQLPLTYRGISESFWVITGSRSDGSLSTDLYLAAESKATVVVLMGYGKLAEIVNIYRERNLHSLPIALIQNGSLPNEKVVFGTIDSILDESTEKRVGVPAIIVIGEVVAKHRSFQEIKEKALAL